MGFLKLPSIWVTFLWLLVGLSIFDELNYRKRLAVSIPLEPRQQEILKNYKAQGYNYVHKIWIVSPNGALVGSGSAFVLKYKNKLYLITNSHVCQPADYTNLVDIRNERKRILKRTRSHKADLCIAPITKLLDLPYLELSEDTITQGDVVYTVGYPEGEYNGTALQFFGVRIQEWITGLKIDNPHPEECIEDDDQFEEIPGMCLALTPMAFAYGQTIPGASGSPVFNEKGTVVGIIAGSVGFMSVFVPSFMLKQFLDEEFPQ